MHFAVRNWLTVDEVAAGGRIAHRETTLKTVGRNRASTLPAIAGTRDVRSLLKSKKESRMSEEVVTWTQNVSISFLDLVLNKSGSRVVCAWACCTFRRVTRSSVLAPSFKTHTICS